MRRRRAYLASSLALFATTALLAWSCSEANAGETRLPPEYRERYEAVEACLGVDVQNPKISFKRTVPCPTSGLVRCMANYPAFQCGDAMCGANASYSPTKGRINMADEYNVSVEHESVHHILFVTGDPDWRDHAHPAFAACGH